MNWRAIWAVVRKDDTVILRYRAILLPMIIIPIVFQVLFPVGFGLAATYAPIKSSDMQDLQQMTVAMPESLRSELAGLDDRQMFFVLMLVYLFAPMYLIVPLMAASVIAADSFAGEKERKTLEALLHSPITIRELLVGKVLSGLIPAVTVSLLSFVLYSVILNAVGWPLMGRIFFPNTMWFILVLWVAPAVSCLGLGISVLVSTRVSTFQEAYQMSGIVVLPVVALMIGQLAGVMFLSSAFALGLGLFLWLVDAALLWFGARVFQREKLLSQL
jgi:ABC-2 type transport system permease protein